MSDVSDTSDTTVAVGLAAGGGVAVLVGLLFGRRLIAVLGAVAGAVGIGLFAKAKLEERQAKVDDASERIRAELDELDPVARAQVLASIATS